MWISSDRAGNWSPAELTRREMRTFIQPQKKQNDEKIEVRLDAEVVQMLREYAEFLESPQGYIITEVLRKAFRKDKAFLNWRNTRRSEERGDASPKSSRKRAPEAVPVAAVS